MPVPNPDDIANHTTFDGKNYYQLKGQSDRALWWSQDAPSWNQGSADDTDELGAEARKPDALRRELKNANKEHQRHRQTAETNEDLIKIDVEHTGQVQYYEREIAEQERYVQLLRHLKSQAANYGSRTWFG